MPLLFPRSLRPLFSRNGYRPLRNEHSHRKGLARPRRCLLLQWLLLALLALVALTAVFRPSYSRPPTHYQDLRARAIQSQTTGRANVLNEKVFISISLYDKDGHLAGGAFGRAVLDLIDLIGQDNVFLSIYENDSGETAAATLEAFKSNVKCKHEIVVESQVDKGRFPTITMPDGTLRLKRLTYLSSMRNRALRPLDRERDARYDKVLILNDVIFNPVEAAQLLFSTNLGAGGRTNYLVACAIDYINPFKFYDVYAARDLDGYSMGVPFFPMFSSAGRALSRQDMLAQKDAVRVKSCWGGMVAFDARYLQPSEPVPSSAFQDLDLHAINPSHPQPVTTPARFRAEPEIFFDACECCLIIADVITLSGRSKTKDDVGVYMNPYVRVAYTPKTLWWLPITRRFERLYSWPHSLVNYLVGMPTYNAHRTVNEGETFIEEIWTNDPSKPGNGSWKVEERTARNGMYCGVREMQVLLDSVRKDDKNWQNTPIPGGRQLF